ncbi:TetR/AcrR family transcriptional regulator [Photobacterium minamisatsumaniensis]|uniref:TetR/AcrR family transcriptional regulator n=1 Tax=Photobacterium minamisatsumaniensis TaxID=2910233 RepID=UPI003D12E0C8
MSRIVKSPEERRAEFIAAANKLFLSKGYAGTSVNDLITEVGVSKGAFYHHFDSKQAVLAAWSDNMLDQYRHMLGGLVVDPNISALDKWQQMLRHSNQWKLDQRDIMLSYTKIINMDENIQLKHYVMQRTSKLLADYYQIIIKQGNSEGVFVVPVPEMTAQLMVSVLFSFSETLTQQLLNHGIETLTVEDVIPSVKATQQAIERMLGAEEGTMPLIDDELLQAWFMAE